MTITAATWYSATCDGHCGMDLENSEGYGILQPTEADLIDYARQSEWVVHQGNLLCEECKKLPACDPHDFVTNTYAAPFCELCTELPNGHPNVPVVGQSEIPAGGESS